MHLHPPRAVKKIFFRPNLQEKCVSAPQQDTKCTPARARVNFRSFCWVVKKCTPADKILATPMLLLSRFRKAEEAAQEEKEEKEKEKKKEEKEK